MFYLRCFLIKINFSEPENWYNAMIAVKSQSIDVRLKPQKFMKSIDLLKKEFDILKFNLNPFEKHHMFIVGRKKNNFYYI